MKLVTRDDVLSLLPETQLVEVLPEKEYAWAHLPGAISIPLRQLQRRAPNELDPARPIVTYCHDLYCDLGPRAASWLSHNGFPDVALFPGAKMDWLAAARDYEGSADLVGRHLEPAPTCRPTDPVRAVAEVLSASPIAVVAEDDYTIIGLLSEETLAKGGEVCAGEVAQFGPPTVRASEECEKLDARLKQHDRKHILVADRTGKLLGLYRRR